MYITGLIVITTKHVLIRKIKKKCKRIYQITLHNKSEEFIAKNKTHVKKV